MFSFFRKKRSSGASVEDPESLKDRALARKIWELYERSQNSDAEAMYELVFVLLAIPEKYKLKWKYYEKYCLDPEFWVFHRNIISYYPRKDCSLKYLKKSAELGFPKALIKLGDVRFSGAIWYGENQFRRWYMVPDHAGALEYYQKAADLGSEEAKAILTILDSKGLFGNRDDREIFDLCAEYAAKENDHALAAMGAFYEFGFGGHVGPDMAKAVEYYQKAACLGNPFAEYYLGICYQEGNGVPQDHEKAFEQLERAAVSKIRNAYYRLGLCYEFGWGTEADRVRAARMYRIGEQNLHHADPVLHSQNNTRIRYRVSEKTESTHHWSGRSVGSELLDLVYGEEEAYYKTLELLYMLTDISGFELLQNVGFSYQERESLVPLAVGERVYLLPDWNDEPGPEEKDNFNNFPYDGEPPCPHYIYICGKPRTIYVPTYTQDGFEEVLKQSAEILRIDIIWENDGIKAFRSTEGEDEVFYNQCFELGAFESVSIDDDPYGIDAAYERMP